MNCFVLKFKNRDLRDVSNKNLGEIFTGDGPKFDLELISKDEKVIGTHTLVMRMFSEFIHEYLIEFKPTSNKICSKFCIVRCIHSHGIGKLTLLFLLLSSIARIFIVCVAACGRFDLQRSNYGWC